MDFISSISFPNEPLVSWTFLGHFCHHFWVGATAKQQKTHPKVSEKMGNWSELHSENSALILGTKKLARPKNVLLKPNTYDILFVKTKYFCTIWTFCDIYDIYFLTDFDPKPKHMFHLCMYNFKLVLSSCQHLTCFPNSWAQLMAY